MRLRYVPLMFVAALAACQTATLSESKRADIAAQVEQRGRGWLQSSDEPAATSFLLAEDVEWIDFGTLTLGRDAYEVYVRGLFGNYQEWSHAWDETNVDVLASDAAVFEGLLSLRRQHNNGQRQEARVFLTAVVKLIDGEWLITRGHLSGAIRNVGQ